MNISSATASQFAYNKSAEIFKMRQPNGDVKKSHPKPMPAEQFPGKGLHLGWAKQHNPHAGPMPPVPIGNDLSGTAPLPATDPTTAAGTKYSGATPKPVQPISATDPLLQKMPLNDDVIQLLKDRAGDLATS